MTRRFALTLALATAALLGACGKQPEPQTPTAAADQATDQIAETTEAAMAGKDVAPNPFFTASTLPYGVPPFDQISDDHYLPAFERGMEEELAEIEVIASNPEPPTFENTIVAMERTGPILQRVSRVFFNLNSAHTNPQMQEVQKTVSPQLAAHQDAIFLNGELFARVEALYAKRDELGLDPESKFLLERYHTDFVRAGARLSEADKEKLRELNRELASLATEFAQNVLQETINSAVLVDTAEELDGLSESQIRAMANAAKERGHEGKFLISLQNTSGQPPLSSLTNRALRQRIHEASVNRGARDNEHDNRPVIARTAALRAERAALLGYPNHAAFVLENATAGTTEAVNAMLIGLAPAAVAEQTFHVEGRDDEFTRTNLGIQSSGGSGGRARGFALRESARLDPPPNQIDLVIRQLRIPGGHRAGRDFLQEKTPDGISRNDGRPRLSPRENRIARL